MAHRDHYASDFRPLAPKRTLRSFFQTTQEFDDWLLSLKPGQYARCNNIALRVKRYVVRKVKIGGGRYFVRRRK